MIYFRVAIRRDQLSQWRWKSSMLSTPGTLFGLLDLYDRVPKDRLRVFFATSKEFMYEMLVRENSGLLSNSITVEDFLKNGRKIDGQRIKELEFELGLQESRELIVRSAITRKLGDENSLLKTAPTIDSTPAVISEARGNILESIPKGLILEDSEWGIGGDHDTPYIFTLPVSTPEALAWARLLAKVQSGELEP